MVVGGIVEKANIPFSVKQKPRFSFPLLAALAQKSNRLCRFLANDDDDDDDLCIIGAVCLYVTKVIILPIPPKVPINRRNCVSPISTHSQKCL